jgi:hypothetical protein
MGGEWGHSRGRWTSQSEKYVSTFKVKKREVKEKRKRKSKVKKREEKKKEREKVR